MNTLHFPDNLDPSHIDTSLVPLNDHMILTNPARPPLENEVKLFKENDWKFLEAPNYSTMKPFPEACFCSPWLSMNMLSIGPNKIIVEETEQPMITFLEQEHGFDVCTLPFRSVYEFGGSLHCATWDVRRRGNCKDYFPNRENNDGN